MVLSSDCLDTCKATPNCTWYTYHGTDSSFCALHLNCPLINVESCPECISGELCTKYIQSMHNTLRDIIFWLGEVSCESTTVCNEPGICTGTLIHEEDANSLANCQVKYQDFQVCLYQKPFPFQATCDSYPGCNYYSYQASSLYCLLFANCPEQDSIVCPDCVTGQPGCDLDGGGNDPGN